MGQNERVLGHVTYFLNFGAPLISPEWLKIEMSNYACRFMVRDAKPKNEKWVKSGRGLGHVAYFSIFGTH